MNVGIDIDGVLFPWDECARDALVDRFGIERPGMSTEWFYLKQHLSTEQWAWLWSAAGSHAVFGQDRIYPGVWAPFKELLKDPARRCHFVTHRDPRRTAVHTATFLDRYFGDHPWAGLHVLQNACPKHSLMEWDVFIDDKPETVMEMLTRTRAQVFTPARPWNEGLATLNTSRLVRYESPWEIVDWLARHV